MSQQFKEILLPIEELPVVLPENVDFHPSGRSPLIDHADFHDQIKQKYGPEARREVDTMDTFVCSSWYFFRFVDTKNSEAFASPEKINSWCPVDNYIIGAEHTVLHLLYSRFFTKALFEAGYIDFDEPFLSIKHPGLVLGTDNRKMSKRWGNVINPTDVIEEYGADTLRIYQMFMGTFDQPKTWNVSAVKGVRRFIERVWNLQDIVIVLDSSSKTDKMLVEVASQLHKLIKKVGEDIKDMSFNTAVAEFMKFMNFVEERSLDLESYLNFLIILSPFAPFITEEMYDAIPKQKFEQIARSKKDSIHLESWPKYSPELIQMGNINFVVQVNGKVRHTLEINQGLGKDEIEKMALESEQIKKWTSGKTIHKVIFVPDKLINIVV